MGRELLPGETDFRSKLLAKYEPDIVEKLFEHCSSRLSAGENVDDIINDIEANPPDFLFEDEEEPAAPAPPAARSQAPAAPVPQQYPFPAVQPPAAPFPQPVPAAPVPQSQQPAAAPAGLEAFSPNNPLQPYRDQIASLSTRVKELETENTSLKAENRDFRAGEVSTSERVSELERRAGEFENRARIAEAKINNALESSERLKELKKDEVKFREAMQEFFGRILKNSTYVAALNRGGVDELVTIMERETQKPVAFRGKLFKMQGESSVNTFEKRLNAAITEAKMREGEKGRPGKKKKEPVAQTWGETPAKEPEPEKPEVFEWRGKNLKELALEYTTEELTYELSTAHFMSLLDYLPSKELEYIRVDFENKKREAKSSFIFQNSYDFDYEQVSIKKVVDSLVDIGQKEGASLKGSMEAQRLKDLLGIDEIPFDEYGNIIWDANFIKKLQQNAKGLVNALRIHVEKIDMIDSKAAEIYRGLGEEVAMGKEKVGEDAEGNPVFVDKPIITNEMWNGLPGRFRDLGLKVKGANARADEEAAKREAAEKDVEAIKREKKDLEERLAAAENMVTLKDQYIEQLRKEQSGALEALRGRVAVISIALTEAESAHRIELKGALEAAEAKYKSDLEKALADAKTKYDKKEEDLKAKHKEELDAAKSKYDSDLEDALADAKTKYDKREEDLKAKHKEELDAAKSKYDSDLEDAKKKHKEELEDLKAKHKEELDAAKSKYDSDLEDAKKKHKEELEDLKAKHKEELDALRKEHAEALEAANRAHMEINNRVFAALETIGYIDEKDAKSLLEKQKKSGLDLDKFLEKSIEEDIKNIPKDSYRQPVLDYYKTKVKSFINLENLRIKHKEELDAAKSKYNSDLDATKKEAAEKIKTLDEKLSATDLRARLAEAKVKDVGRELADARREALYDILNLELDLEAADARYKSDLDATKKEAAEKIKTLDEKLSATDLRARLAEAKVKDLERKFTETVRKAFYESLENDRYREASAEEIEDYAKKLLEARTQLKKTRIRAELAETRANESGRSLQVVRRLMRSFYNKSCALEKERDKAIREGADTLAEAGTEYEKRMAEAGAEYEERIAELERKAGAAELRANDLKSQVDALKNELYSSEERSEGREKYAEMAHELLFAIKDIAKEIDTLAEEGKVDELKQKVPENFYPVIDKIVGYQKDRDELRARLNAMKDIDPNEVAEKGIDAFKEVFPDELWELINKLLNKARGEGKLEGSPSRGSRMYSHSTRSMGGGNLEYFFWINRKLSDIYHKIGQLRSYERYPTLREGVINQLEEVQDMSTRLSAAAVHNN